MNQPTFDDLALIAELKTERLRLKRELEQLTDRAIAEKFDVSLHTVREVRPSVEDRL